MMNIEFTVKIAIEHQQIERFQLMISIVYCSSYFISHITFLWVNEGFFFLYSFGAAFIFYLVNELYIYIPFAHFAMKIN